MGLLDKTVFLGRIIKGRITGKPIHLFVIFNITDECNLHCEYCYAKYYKRGYKDLSKEQIFSIIDELAQLGTKRISLCGGEPLIRKDVGEIIQHIKNRKIECVVLSNGTFVSRRINELKSIDAICLSFDGYEEAHDYHRGKGSYKDVMKAIKVCKENGIRVYTNSVVTKRFLDAIDFILETAKEYQFLAQINLFTGQVSEDLDSKKPSSEECRAAIRKILEYKRRGYPVFFSEKAYELTLNWPDYQQEIIIGEPPTFNHVSCYAGRYFFVLDTNGNLFPCPKLVDRIKAPNCLDMGLKNAVVEVGKHTCKACHWTCYVEFNLTFDLNINTILNNIRNSSRF